MSNRRSDELINGPRRRVRYTRLLEAWPECPLTTDPTEAILQAPVDAVIAALTAELEHYSDLLNSEREERRQLDAQLDRLVSAVRVIADQAGRIDAAMMLDFDAPPAVVTVDTGGLL